MPSFDEEKREIFRGRITDALGRGLDRGLEPYIEAINRNPDIMTTQSCSGLPYPDHAGQGHPYVEIQFRNHDVKARYQSKLKAAGYEIRDFSDVGRLLLYVEIPNTTTLMIKQQLNVDPVERAKILRPYCKSEAEVQRIIKGQHEDALNGRLATPQECQQFWRTVTSILTTQ